MKKHWRFLTNAGNIQRFLYLSQSGTLFEDPEFPSDNDLLRVRSARHIDDLEWQRPQDFVRPDEPILVSSRNEGFDIRQGLDAWFVPAMAAIAESEALLNQVFSECV